MLKVNENKIKKEYSIKVIRKKNRTLKKKWKKYIFVLFKSLLLQKEKVDM